MITNIDGKFMSTIYTVTNGEATYIVGSSHDLLKELRKTSNIVITRDDADAILYGETTVQGFYVKDITEIELKDRNNYGSE